MTKSSFKWHLLFAKKDTYEKNNQWQRTVVYTFKFYYSFFDREGILDETGSHAYQTKNRSKHGELGDIKNGGIAMAAALIASINHKKGEHYCEKFGTLWR